MNRILLCSIATAFAAVTAGRAEGDLFGTVTEQIDGSTQPLYAATIQWIGNSARGTNSDRQGHFRLSRRGIADERIVVRYVGYEPDTLSVAGLDSIHVVFDTPMRVDNIVVQESRDDSRIMTSTLRTDVISGAEIEQDACCDLSGCFNTSASAEANVTDFVTDKRELQILGMSGVYNQVLVDGMPMLMTGLNSGYGLNLIPGPFIKRISVVKGANSVLQGDESITGIVDVRIKDPKDINGAFANLFVNAHMEKQLNLAYAQIFSDSWSAMVAGHVTLPSMHVDEGGDSFLDMPLTTRYSVFSKWKYEQEPGEDSGIISTAFVKYTDEERVGGQQAAHSGGSHHGGSVQPYVQTVETDRIEGYVHLTALAPDSETGLQNKAVLSVAGSMHRQDALFGTTSYRGEQHTLYADARAETELSTSFLVRGGIDYRLENIDETIDLGANLLNKTYGGSYEFGEWSVGPYVESVITLFDNDLTLMPGVRMDYGNSLAEQNVESAQPQLSTRLFALYRPDELTTFRASFGTGSRPVRFWSENSTALASGRNILRLPTTALSEDGVNYGAGVAKIVDIAGILTTFSVDYYRTILHDHLYFDYESGNSLLLASGEANSHSIQAEINADITAEWRTKLAYNFLEAMREENGVDKIVPFTAKHRFLATLSFMPAETAWQFDGNLHLYGRQRLPSTALLPEEYRRPDYSDPYALLNTQVTYRWNALDLYAGVENLLNFRQNNPVIDPEHPFGQYFDTSYIWGPVKGREFYAGIRYTLQVQ